MWLLSALSRGEIEASQRLAEIFFSCTACGNCMVHCAMPDFRDLLVEIFIAGKEKIIDEGMVPPGPRDFLTRLQTHGNPYGKSPARRAEFLFDSGVSPYAGQEYLLYVDDVSAYDPVGREMSVAVCELLAESGISFGAAGREFVSDGCDARAAGEVALFEHLARKNIKAFENLGVKKIITLSPHAAYAFSMLYPALGARVQAFHYTQVLAFFAHELLAGLRVDPSVVTFHDPCYLSRFCGDTGSPRAVLGKVSGIELAEMERAGKDALCCGGGGGNLFFDLYGTRMTPARERAKEAARTGASVIAVACPQCAVMLADAVKTEGLEDKLQVKGICDIIRTQTC